MDEATDTRAHFVERAIDAHGNAVLRLACARTLSAADAEDVFQTVFLRLFQHGQNFASDEHVKAWLLRVTVNCCNDVHRRSWGSHATALSDDMASCERPQDAPDARTAVEERVADAVANLPDKQRVAVHLHYYEGYATEEVAGITGESPSTVRSHLHRARQSLKQSLGGIHA